MVKTDRKTRKREHESMTEAKIGFSNPAIKGRPVPYPKGHPEEGKPMEFNKAETEGKNRYDRYNRKHGTKIRADQPLPEEKIVEAKDKPGKGSGKKDACYHKVKSRYSVLSLLLMPQVLWSSVERKVLLTGETNPKK